MKVFWSIMAVLLIAAVAAAFIPDEDDGPSLIATVNTQAPDDDVFARPNPTASSDVVADGRAATDPVVESPGTSAGDDESTASPQLSNNAVASEDDEDTSTSLTDIATTEVTTTEVTGSTTSGNNDNATATDGEATAAEGAQLAATENDAEEAAADPAPADLLNATVEEQPDGSLLIADKYTVRGTGEIDDPYTLPWDMLVSLSSVYKPREGQKELPDFIMRMHDRQVKITGYVAFPMVAGEIEELLIMLNQWDGCCVGVPPTVYDSVEVRLVEPIITTGASTTMPYGTVTGRMTIDPYFVNDWLVGLYLMEEAEIDLDL